MRITVSNKATKWSDFEKTEWAVADKEHYGHIIDWKKKDFVIKVFEGKNLVGTLRMDVVMGVAYIYAVIVSKIKRYKGIGRKLIEKAEKVAIENGAHKISLQTGKNWDAVRFYEKCGYKIMADLSNHFFHHHFVEMTKFLHLGDL